MDLSAEEVDLCIRTIERATEVVRENLESTLTRLAIDECYYEEGDRDDPRGWDCGFDMGEVIQNTLNDEMPEAILGPTGHGSSGDIFWETFCELESFIRTTMMTLLSVTKSHGRQPLAHGRGPLQGHRGPGFRATQTSSWIEYNDLASKYGKLLPWEGDGELSYDDDWMAMVWITVNKEATTELLQMTNRIVHGIGPGIAILNQSWKPHELIRRMKILVPFHLRGRLGRIYGPAVDTLFRQLGNSI